MPIDKSIFLKKNEHNHKLTTIDADNISQQNNLTKLSGNIILKRTNQFIRSDKAIIDNTNGQKKTTFSGNIIFQDKTTIIKSQKIVSSDHQESSFAEEAFFAEKESKIRGYAKKLDKKNDNLSYMTDAYFTSCPEDKEDWKIKSENIRLDYKIKQGKAKNIVMDYKGFPIFYSPILYFPLSDDRLSGFLSPDYASSTRNGIEISVPYYFNITPNFDYTLTPKYMSNTGLMLNNELRYLTPESYWEIEGDFLASDKISQTQRSSLRLKQKTDLKNFKMTTDITSASDKNFFSDFGNTLETSNNSHLIQKIDFFVPIANKELNINFLGYQTLDQSIVDTSLPYQLLPKISYRNEINQGFINIPYQLQWSNFYHTQNTIGHRFYFKPEVSKTYQGTAWSIKPKLSLDMTYYNLTTNTGLKQKHSRNLPIFSIDSSIYLEKTISGKGTIQLLEPRLFYLYIPYQDQSNIPLFDTKKSTSNFGQLFRENQYSGLDRLQNANQLTSSLSLKELDLYTGKEKFRVQAGVISYFDTPKVNLSNEPLSASKGSNILFQLDNYFQNNVNSQYFLEYDFDNKALAKQTVFIRYNNKKEIINLTWNKTQNTETTDEQVSASSYWPLLNNWQFIGRKDYSLSKKTEILSTLGLEYDNCCFQFRIAYNRKPVVNNDTFNEGIVFQLVFKSLNRPGTGIGQKWQEQITGYQDPYQK